MPSGPVVSDMPSNHDDHRGSRRPCRRISYQQGSCGRSVALAFTENPLVSAPDGPAVAGPLGVLHARSRCGERTSHRVVIVVVIYRGAGCRRRAA